MHECAVVAAELGLLLAVLVSLGCRNRIPQTRPLRQQKFLIVLEWEVQDQNTSKAGFFLRPHLLPCKAATILLCAHIISSVYIYVYKGEGGREKERKKERGRKWVRERERGRECAFLGGD